MYVDLLSQKDLQRLKNSLRRLSFNLWSDYCVWRVLADMMDAIAPSFQGFPFAGDFGDIGLLRLLLWPIAPNRTAFCLTSLNDSSFLVTTMS